MTSKSGRVRVGAIVVILIIIAVLVAGFFFIKSRKKGDTISSEYLPFGVNDKWAYTGEGFMYLKGEYLSYRTLGGRIVYSDKRINESNVTLSGYKSYDSMQCVFTDKTLYIVNAKNTVTFSGSYVIEDVKTADGCCAVLVGYDPDLSGGFEKEAIYLYSTDGERTDEIELTHRVISFDFTNTSPQYLFVAELNLDSTVPVTQITLYNPYSGSMRGSKTLVGELPVELIFTDKSLFAVTCDHIIRYEIGSDSKTSVICTGYNFIASEVSQGKAYFLMENASSKGEMALYRINDTKVVDENVTRFRTAGDSLTAYVKDGSACVVYNNRIVTYRPGDKMTTVSEKNFAAPVAGAVYLGQGYLLCETSGQYSLIKS